MSTPDEPDTDTEVDDEEEEEEEDEPEPSGPGATLTGTGRLSTRQEPRPDAAGEPTESRSLSTRPDKLLQLVSRKVEVRVRQGSVADGVALREHVQQLARIPPLASAAQRVLERLEYAGSTVMPTDAAPLEKPVVVLNSERVRLMRTLEFIFPPEPENAIYVRLPDSALRSAESFQRAFDDLVKDTDRLARAVTGNGFRVSRTAPGSIWLLVEQAFDAQVFTFGPWALFAAILTLVYRLRDKEADIQKKKADTQKSLAEAAEIEARTKRDKRLEERAAKDDDPEHVKALRLARLEKAEAEARQARAVAEAAETRAEMIALEAKLLEKDLRRDAGQIVREFSVPGTLGAANENTNSLVGHVKQLNGLLDQGALFELPANAPDEERALVPIPAGGTMRVGEVPELVRPALPEPKPELEPKPEPAPEPEPEPGADLDSYIRAPSVPSEPESED